MKKSKPRNARGLFDANLGVEGKHYISDGMVTQLPLRMEGRSQSLLYQQRSLTVIEDQIDIEKLTKAEMLTLLTSEMLSDTKPHLKPSSGRQTISDGEL